MDLLPLAAINSVTLLGAELVGRAYGGGILKLEPREADRLPVPSFSLIKAKARALRALYRRASVALRQGKLAEVVSIVDQVLLSEGTRLTLAQIRDLREARSMLFGRRIARAAKTNGAG
jgi:hypothetical protein